MHSGATSSAIAPSATILAPAKRARAGAFTLIELLVVISIIGLLLGVLLPALGRAKGAAKVAQELASCQQLLVGYQLFAEAHQEYVLPALNEPDRGPRQLRETPLDHYGRPVQGQPAKRFFWRLASYVDYNFEVFFRDRERLKRYLLDEAFYEMSVYPSFGINHRFVGGEPKYYPKDGDSAPTLYQQTWGQFWIARLYDAARPSDLFTFVSSAGELTGEIQQGYFTVEGPYFNTQVWQTFELPARAGVLPAAVKNVWPVENNLVVTGRLDGHAAATPWEETHDMRHWSPQADAHDWRLEFP